MVVEVTVDDTKPMEKPAEDDKLMAKPAEDDKPMESAEPIEAAAEKSAVIEERVQETVEESVLVPNSPLFCFLCERCGAVRALASLFFHYLHVESNTDAADGSADERSGLSPLQRRLRGHGELFPRDDAGDAPGYLRGSAGGAALHQRRWLSLARSHAALHAQPAHHRRRRPRAEEAGESAAAAGDGLQGQLRARAAATSAVRPAAVARARVDGEGLPERDDAVRAGVRGGGEFARGAAS